MHPSRIFCAWLILFGSFTATVQANWMSFTGGPIVANGTWPGTSGLSGTAQATQSNYVNGNNSTGFIGLSPQNIGSLSSDFYSYPLQDNAGNIVPMLGAPYNDVGDKYHVDIDFSNTTGGPNPNVLPAGTLFAVIDLDIYENFRKVSATNAANVQITTPWISGPLGYIDMTNPMLSQPSIAPGPTLTGPAGGVYDMFGIVWNFDAGMWLFNTTQDIRVLSFDMEDGFGGNGAGTGGAGWAFYAPGSGVVPEPSCLALLATALLISAGRTLRSRHRRSQ